MKKRQLTSLLCAMVLAPIAVAETLNVAIENVETSDGFIMLRVMNGEAEFKGDTSAISSIQHRAMAGQASFTIGDLPAGEYAVQVMHDRNGNGELDSNFVGMPTEPWAFSNNATGSMGPPSWDDVKFELKGSVDQSIKLNH